MEAVFFCAFADDADGFGKVGIFLRYVTRLFLVPSFSSCADATTLGTLRHQLVHSTPRSVDSPYRMGSDLGWPCIPLHASKMLRVRDLELNISRLELQLGSSNNLIFNGILGHRPISSVNSDSMPPQWIPA